jgi:hypothetical protein
MDYNLNHGLHLLQLDSKFENFKKNFIDENKIEKNENKDYQNEDFIENEEGKLVDTKIIKTIENLFLDEKKKKILKNNFNHFFGENKIISLNNGFNYNFLCIIRYSNNIFFEHSNFF